MLLTHNSALTTISLRLEQLTKGYTEQVTGNIWFECEDYAFPEKQWNDFAETITGWWVSTLIEVYRSNNKWHEKSLLFMDGPCKAVLRNGSPVTIHFNFNDQTQRSFTISLVQFTKELISIRRSLLRQVIAAGWRKSTYAELEQCDWLETLVCQAEKNKKAGY